MFMPFDRQHLHVRRAHIVPTADATGTPSAPRGGTDRGRLVTSEPRDYREQADGAP